MSFGTIFSGVVSAASTGLSAAGTALSTVFSTVKAYLIVAAVVVFVMTAGSFIWYYHYAEAKLQTAAANQAELTNALTQENATVKQLQDENNLLTQSYKDLMTKENQVQQQNDKLKQQIQNYDFSHQPLTNHDKAEKDINDQTQKLLKGFEDISNPNNNTIGVPVAPKKGK